MLRQIITATILLAITVTACGCGAGEDTRLMSLYLVDHLKKNGVNGRFRRLKAESIGATQGGRYSSTDRNDPFMLEFAKFDSPEKARRLAARGFRSPDTGRVYPVYQNGVYAMIVRVPSKKHDIVAIFKNY